MNVRRFAIGCTSSSVCPCGRRQADRTRRAASPRHALCAHGLKKACLRCGRLTKHEFLVGFEYIRCDTIMGEVEVELALIRRE